jgi:hypothetical protein
MTYFQKNSRKMYQTLAYYKDDNNVEQVYTTAIFDNISDAHTIYEYAISELENNFCAVELVEHNKNEDTVVLDRETTKGYKACRTKERKSLRLIMRKRQEEVDKERNDAKHNALLDKQKLFEKRVSDMVQFIISSRPDNASARGEAPTVLKPGVDYEVVAFAM